jgi:hypothetical protein
MVARKGNRAPMNSESSSADRSDDLYDATTIADESDVTTAILPPSKHSDESEMLSGVYRLPAATLILRRACRTDQLRQGLRAVGKWHFNTSEPKSLGLEKNPEATLQQLYSPSITRSGTKRHEQRGG